MKEYKQLSMMDFRKNPGTIIDRMRFLGERFILTRKDRPMAYLIPVNNLHCPSSDGVDAVVSVEKDGRFRLVDPGAKGETP